MINARGKREEMFEGRWVEGTKPGRHYSHENIMTWETAPSPFPVSSRMGGVNKGLSS
jgi:hypothetical protein